MTQARPRLLRYEHVMLLIGLASLPANIDVIDPLELPKGSSKIRIAHSHELVGKAAYETNGMAQIESEQVVAEFIEQRLSEDLPEAWRTQARELTQVILAASEDADFDPLFVMAVMQRESRMNPVALGRHGEIGLMQIKPSTAKWIAEKSGLEWHGRNSLLMPEENIRLGIAYFKMLRSKYTGNSDHYLSAYNMGTARLRQKLAEKKSPMVYSSGVRTRYLALYSDMLGRNANHVADLK